MIDELITALSTALSTEAVFYPAVPSNIVAPAVIVTPGEPFIEPATHGTVMEHWDVLVAVSVGDPDRGLVHMRQLSLEVREAAGSVGALWTQTERPKYISQENTSLVVMRNHIEFRYDPTSVTDS